MDAWPICPRCRKPRTTVCPYCHTAGTGFPAADSPAQDSADATAADDPPAQACEGGCGCGAGGCGGLTETAEPAEPLGDLVLCPTCDEPFEPKFYARCEWCGQGFSGKSDVLEGAPSLVPNQEPAETINGRILLALGLMVLLIGGMVAYVALALGRPAKPAGRAAVPATGCWAAWEGTLRRP